MERGGGGAGGTNRGGEREVGAKCSGGPGRRAEVSWSGGKKTGVRKGMSQGGKGKRESKRE